MLSDSRVWSTQSLRSGHGRDIVVLVPGFIGFGRLGSVSYFADRVLAALRVGVEMRIQRPVQVAGIKTDPAGSLKSRQQVLLSGLERLDKSVEGAETFHLVGHSTGGVDAELLTCKYRLDGKPWSPAQQSLRRRIASISTISAPHYGTSIVESPAAKWFLHPWSGQGAMQALGLAGSLILLARSRADLSLQALTSVIYDGAGSTALFLRLVSSRALVDDLRPEKMIKLRKDNPPDPEIPVSVRCFVTVGPKKRRPGELPDCDQFYSRLHELTEKYALRQPDVETERFTKVLEAIPASRIIHHPDVEPEGFGPEANDGVANTARQILETHVQDRDPAKALGSIVVGDHGDVLGYYDRLEQLTDGGRINHGLFRSGASFRDDQFFRLWHEVADHIMLGFNSAEARTDHRLRAV